MAERTITDIIKAAADVEKEVGADKTAAPDRTANKAQKAKTSKRTSSKGALVSKPSGQSKKGQLIALLSKPNGVRVSVLIDKLGWQAHTVRAGLSGLRKHGYQIEKSKHSKTGETVYAIVTSSSPPENNEDATSKTELVSGSGFEDLESADESAPA